MQIFDCTPVPTMAVLLFGQSQSEKQKSVRSKVIVNGWIHLGISEVHAVLVRKVQREIESILSCKVKIQGDSTLLREKEMVVTKLMEKILKVDM